MNYYQKLILRMVALVIFSYILFILTKDISLKNIIKMLSFGFGAIFVANLLRLTFLISILEINEKFFDFWHLLIWKVIATLFVALVWILLIKRYKVNNTPIY